mgnify:CR=1 FL=1
MEPGELYHEMWEACAKVAEAHRMPRSWFCWPMLISWVQIRNGVIRAEYNAERKWGDTDALKKELSWKYGVGEDHLNKILYEK